EAELSKVIVSLPPAVRDKAGPLQELLRQSTQKQGARLARFEPLLRGGSAERGRAVFFGKKATCATCHRVGTEGGQVGPDLTRIAAVRSARALLEAVVLPSASIAQGYDNYLVTTKDGRTVGGVIARRSGDTLFLRDSSGAELRLRRDDVQEMHRQA